MEDKEMYEEGNTHLLTLQRQVIFTLVFFADNAQLGEVTQLWVYGEFTELIANPGQEVHGMCTGCNHVQHHGTLTRISHRLGTTGRPGRYPIEQCLYLNRLSGTLQFVFSHPKFAIDRILALYPFYIRIPAIWMKQTRGLTIPQPVTFCFLQAQEPRE